MPWIEVLTAEFLGWVKVNTFDQFLLLIVLIWIFTVVCADADEIAILLRFLERKFIGQINEVVDLFSSSTSGIAALITSLSGRLRVQSRTMAFKIFLREPTRCFRLVKARGHAGKLAWGHIAHSGFERLIKVVDGLVQVKDGVSRHEHVI